MDQIWLQLVFITDPISAEPLSDALEEAGSAAVTMLDAADQALFDTGQEEASLWDQTRLIALFPDAIDPDLILAQIKEKLKNLPPHEVIPLQNEDWERTWMSRFKPMRFGKNLWVCPSWEIPPEPGAINLILDPGMAFGTGTHETTSLCLGWLADHQSLIEEKQIIDYGCGSGILAIAAAKLGAKSVWAVDIEQQALDSTRENARSNFVLEALDISGQNESKQIKADLIIANILANPLITLAPLFAGYSAPDGHIILSGILKEQVSLVLEAYQPFYSFTDTIYMNEWALLEGTLKSQ